MLSTGAAEDAAFARPFLSTSWDTEGSELITNSKDAAILFVEITSTFTGYLNFTYLLASQEYGACVRVRLLLVSCLRGVVCDVYGAPLVIS